MALNAHALTSVQRLADFLGLGTITAGSTKETLLQMVINSVTAFVESYCKRRFKETTYTQELYDGDGTQFLFLKNYPVDSSGTFTLERRESALNEDDWEQIDSEYFYVDYDAGYIETANESIRFIPGVKNYRVTYTAGIAFNLSSTFLSDSTADLEYAAWKLCATVYNRRHGDAGIQSESIGDVSVTYTKEVFENEEIKSILDKYARHDAHGTITSPNV